MKINLRISILGLLLLFVLAPNISKAQEECDDLNYEDKCAESLFDVFDDYLFLRSRVISYKDNDEMFTVTLKRNILYVFNVCDRSGKNNLTINLFDKDDKLISSSSNEKSNSNVLTFRPVVSGKYYISTIVKNDYKGCSLLILGMIKKNIEQYLPGAK